MRKMEEILPTLNVLWRLRSHKRKHLTKKEMQPTAVLLSGESHSQRSLGGYCSRGHKESDSTERRSTRKLWAQGDSQGIDTPFLLLKSVLHPVGAPWCDTPGCPRLTQGHSWPSLNKFTLHCITLKGAQVPCWTQGWWSLLLNTF